MGMLIILIGGVIGALSAPKKNFAQNWIFFLNICFSLYAAIFLAPLLIPLLDFLPAGWGESRNAVAVGGFFLCIDMVLNRICEQVFPNPENELSLPAYSKILSVLFGFLSGILIAAVAVYCFMQLPFTGNLSFRKDFRMASRKVLLHTVHTMNFFSLQSLSPAAEKDFEELHLLPKKKLPDKSENKANEVPAESKSGQGDGSAVSGKATDHPPSGGE